MERNLHPLHLGHNMEPRVTIQKNAGYGGRGQLCIPVKVSGRVSRKVAIEAARQFVMRKDIREAFADVGELTGYPFIDCDYLSDLTLQSATPLCDKIDSEGRFDSDGFTGVGIANIWQVIFCYQRGNCVPEQDRAFPGSTTITGDRISSLASYCLLGGDSGSQGTAEPTDPFGDTTASVFCDIKRLSELDPIWKRGQLFRNCEGIPQTRQFSAPACSIEFRYCIPNSCFSRREDAFQDFIQGFQFTINATDFIQNDFSPALNEESPSFKAGTLLIQDIQIEQGRKTSELVITAVKDVGVCVTFPWWNPESQDIDPAGLTVFLRPHHILDLFCHEIPAEGVEELEEIAYERAEVHQVYPYSNYQNLNAFIRDCWERDDQFALPGSLYFTEPQVESEEPV